MLSVSPDRQHSASDELSGQSGGRDPFDHDSIVCAPDSVDHSSLCDRGGQATSSFYFWQFGHFDRLSMVKKISKRKGQHFRKILAIRIIPRESPIG
jgi:hypothetical protein